jgi:hypothetical protein
MAATLRFIALPLLLLVLFVVPARADELKTARTVISGQVALIKKGDVAKLRKGFTERLQDRITAATVKAAQKEVGSYALEDLVDKVELRGSDAIKVKMKNGRSLTTLVKVDGAWLADTLWFR